MRVVLVLLLLLLLTPAAQAQGPVRAEMDTRLEPEVVTVSLEDNQTVLLHIDARLPCVPGLAGPRDVQGFLSRHGWAGDSFYWRAEPTDFKIPWEQQDSGEWVIDDMVSLRIFGNAPAPERIAGEERTQVHLNGASPRSLAATPGGCSPAGYSWDHRSHDLTINIPLGVEDNAVTNQTAGAGNPGGGWSSTAIALLAIYGALVTLIAIARVRKRR